MCELTLQMILLCNCSLSLKVYNIGLQCNWRFLSTTVLQGSVATWVNDDGIFNDFFIANLLLSVTVKEFWDRLGFGKVIAKNKVAPFFRTRCIYRQNCTQFHSCILVISLKKQKMKITVKLLINAHPRRLLEHGLHKPRRPLETGVYSRPGTYENTGIKPPVSVACYNTGYTVTTLMFMLLLSSSEIDSGVKLAHQVVCRMF